MTDKANLKRNILQTILVCAAAVLVCLFLYRYDNKYNTASPRGMNGVLLFDELDAVRCNFLVDGWAVYGGVLLSPEDFLHGNPKPDEYVFIGQYGGFEKLTGSPHGSVTYRLVIGIPEERRTYTLALPEIFSSCRVYVNGVQRIAMGEPEPSDYRFETGNAVITVDANGKIDILIAVSDFTHLYSGMVYPPGIGETGAVTHMLYTRLALRSAALAATLIIGAVSLFIGMMSGRREGRRKTLALYGLLCLLFAGYTCYPVTMTLLRGMPPLYLIENASFCVMLLVVITMQDMICPNSGRTDILRSCVLGFGAFVCLASLITPLFLPHAGLSLMMAYSGLISVYQWVTACYITFVSGLAVWKDKTGSIPLFWGMLVLDCTLVMDRALHSFEPILSGWFPELGSFALVVSLGVTSVREIIRSYRENAVMEERVRIVLSSGREHYQKMNEMYDTLRILRHDYKYHLSVVREALRSKNKEMMDKVDNYLISIETKLAENEPQIFYKDPVINALLCSYAERCSKLDIRYEVKVSTPATISVPDYEMCIIIGNLLENALEACQRKERNRSIKLVIKTQGEHLAIMVKNTFGGMISENAGRPASTKDDGGFGLRSIEAVASRYDGHMQTRWSKDVFTTSVLLRL